MGLTVCKFGGTSTANAQMLRQIRQILDDDPDRRYVVLSAPGANGADGRVTDQLARLWRARRDGAAAEAIILKVVRRFRRICEGLGIPDKDGVVRRELERAVSVSEAHTLSRGEYLIARLFCGYSGLPMVDAADVVAFDRAGALDAEATLARFRAMARRLHRAVIPGFYGSAPDGAIVTLPRNGSDITGALAAAGVGATLYENWTDVPGLMTADPDVDPGATVIPAINYAGMRRLAERGARVLHPESLGPVARAGIPTRLKCTMAPEAPGTLIGG